MLKKISIITATFNSGKTVADTLQSVAIQDYGLVEHLIVDGLSSDNTLDIVAGFPHVTHVVSGKDKGIYDAMNKGIAMATGEVIGILNSDDFYPNEKVLSSVMKVFSDTNCDAVFGDLVYVDAIRIDKITRVWRSGQYRENAFLWGWMPPHPTLFVRKSVYEQYGLFQLDLSTAADYELMLRFIHRYRISVAYLPEVLVKMRTGGASNASLKNRLVANAADREAWRINGLKPFFFTLYLKPLRKLGQFLVR